MAQEHREKQRSLAAWMLILGALATFIGVNGARDWNHFSSALQGYLGVSLLAGVALITGGALSLSAQPARRWALLSGLVAALALGINHTIALWFNIIPCDTPG
jgi:hypothetical protein